MPPNPRTPLLSTSQVDESPVDEPELGSPELRTQLQTLWRRKWIIVACAVLAPAAAFFLSARQTKLYESSAVVQIQSQAVDTSLFTGSSDASGNFLAAAARITKTTAMARVAAKRLRPRPRDPRALLGQLTVTPDDDAGFLTITAADPAPKQAAAVANAFAAALRVTRAAKARAQIDPAIRAARRNLEQLRQLDPDDTAGIRELSEQIQRLHALRASQGSNVAMIEPAVPATTPSAPRPLRDAITAFLLAVLVGVGLAFLVEGLDRRIRDIEVLEKLAGLSLLSMVPIGKPSDSKQAAEVGESFETLRASLTYFNIDRKLESIIICSPVKGDGKTSVATNLAKAVARAGQRVVVIDLDMRHPQVDVRLTGQRARFGVGAVLVGERTVEEAMIPVDVPEGDLRILPSGPPPPNPSKLIASHRMRSLLIEVSSLADLVIIDSPPTLLVSDTIPLFKRVSGIVVVTRLGKTTRESLRRLLRVIRTAGGQPLGIVATSTRAGGLYGYGYYGGYGSGTGEEDVDLPADGNGRMPAPEEDDLGAFDDFGDEDLPRRRRRLLTRGRGQ